MFFDGEKNSVEVAVSGAKVPEVTVVPLDVEVVEPVPPEPEELVDRLVVVVVAGGLPVLEQAASTSARPPPKATRSSLRAGRFPTAGLLPCRPGSFG
jgi:hypothetical protein